MALSKDQQAELDRLQQLAGEPPKRTTTGLAGLLHTLIDLISGRVPHVSPEATDELHATAEDLAGDGQDQAAPAGDSQAPPADAGESSGTETEPE